MPTTAFASLRNTVHENPSPNGPVFTRRMRLPSISKSLPTISFGRGPTLTQQRQTSLGDADAGNTDATRNRDAASHAEYPQTRFIFPSIGLRQAEHILADIGQDELLAHRRDARD